MGPTFLVIGAAKCGTTTLCDLLDAHPDVFVTDPKEPHYFARVKREPRREWYESLFAGAGESQARGEGSTSYSHPNRISLVVPTLRKLVPECRLVYIVRHPVRRLESDWRMRRLEGRATAPIGEALDHNVTLVTVGLYWKILSAYRALFPDEQILVLFLEDLAVEPEQEIRRVYRHIGVDPEFTPPTPDRKQNTATARRRGKAASRLKTLVPGAEHLKPILPDPFVEWAVGLVARGQPEGDPVVWDPGSLEAVVDFFREDSRRLLAYCGKPENFWSWRQDDG